MQRSVLLALAAGMVVGPGACSSHAGQAPRVATGAVAHLICAQAFVSGENPDRIYADTFKPLPGMWLLDWGMRYDVDAAHREVRTRFAGGFESRAVYRDGIGCTNVQGDGPLDRIPPEDSAALESATAPLLPEIAGPEIVEPADPRLRTALDREFTEADHPPYRRTKAVVVVHDGRVIAERYAPGYGIETPILGNSITKSVTNALIGILVRDGRLSVDKPAPVAAWADPGDPRHNITLDQLLRMQSGLALGDSLGGGLSSLWNPSVRMLFVERDMAGFAESAALEATPGTLWNYSDGNYLILSRIIRDAVGGHMADVLRFAHRELFDPLGMRHAVLQFDATGTPQGANSMLATARDWARFGMLYLDDGVIAGRRILPEGWVGYSARPTPDAWIGYGAGFWTNLDDSFGAQNRRRLGMPADAFLAKGKFGQHVIIVPSARLVIVRLGVTHGWEDIDGVSRLTADVIAALDGPSGRVSLGDRIR